MKIVLEITNRPVAGDVLVVVNDSTVQAVSQVTFFKSLTDRITQLESDVSDLKDRVSALENRLDVQEGVE